MKTGLSGMIKWLALAVFVLAAGCCYSCGLSGGTVGLSHAEEPQAEADLKAETGLKAESDGEAPEKTAEEQSGEAPEKATGQPAGEAAAEPAAQAAAAEQAAQAAVMPPRTCFVHVCGEVASPGVYELAEGQRVFEAVELAGGFTAEAAESYLNLAEPVQDGMKVLVPGKSELPKELLSGIPADAGTVAGAGITGGISIAAGAGKDAAAGAKVNINTAAKEELMTLKGIGEARAEDIIRYREERGGFDRIEDIMEVSGIKDAAFQKMKEDITV